MTSLVTADAEVEQGTGRLDSSAYRAFFTVPPTPGLVDRVLEQLYVWLREKGWDPRLDATGYEQQAGCELFVQHHRTEAERRLRVRLTEESPIGEWRTELTVVEPRPPGEGWISIVVTNAEGRFADVPRIATYVLDVVNGFDGPAALIPEPVLLSTQGVEELLEELCVEEREGLVFVAGTADDSDIFPAFQARVARLMRQVRGLARVVVLDPHATAEFERGLGATHAVSPWTIRTYQPSVDPAVELDARRHRILGLPSLAQRPDAELIRLLGRVARAHAAGRALPESVLQVSRALSRLEAQAAVSELSAPRRESPSQAPDAAPGPDSPAQRPTSEPGSLDQVIPVHQEASAYLAQIELVKRVLDVDAVEEPLLRDLAERARRGEHVEAAAARVSRQLEEAQTRVYALEDEVAYYREYAEEEEFERVLLEDERARLLDEVRWLRERLREAEATDAVPETAYTRYPTSFEELVSRVAELEDQGVVFCADPRRVTALDDHDTLGKLVRAAWDALLVLGDYLRARRTGDFDGGLDGYLQQTPGGYRTVPPKKFAPTETARTMQEFGGERMFPVPRRVSRSREAEMKAHFKLGRVGMVSPRMYLLDRFAIDQRVYVGYLGEHLTNTQTR